MKFEIKKVVAFIIMNTILLVSLAMGIHAAIDLATQIGNTTSGSIYEFVKIAQDFIITFLSQDIKIIIAVIAIASIISYDIWLFWRWFNSFGLTRDHQCTRCKKHIIREHRRPGDRLISVVIPLKRFRCVGCGKEYLKADGKYEVDEKSVVKQMIRK